MGIRMVITDNMHARENCAYGYVSGLSLPISQERRTSESNE